MSKKTKKEYYGKIIDISDDISIFADRNQYIVKYGKHNRYFGSLEECFSEIFEERVKVRLIENQKKDIKEIIKIIENTRKWLKNIFGEIEKPLF